MLDSLICRLGLKGKKTEGESLGLKEGDVGRQASAFNQEKERLDAKIQSLNERTARLDEGLDQTLNITSANQARLKNMEDEVQRLIGISRQLLSNPEKNRKDAE